MSKFITIVAIALLSISANAQNQLVGLIKNKSNEPLAGATIKLEPGNYETISNSSGVFKIIDIKNNTYQLTIRYVGYKVFTKSISISKNTTLNITLDKSLQVTNEVIVSATRATDKTPTSYTNITKKAIKEFNATKDIPYLLQLTPSVVATSDAGTGIGYTNFRVRGTDLNRINVTVNDIPLNDAESHGVWFVNMPNFIESTSSIQIQRGTTTSSSGAAAFGASINMQTNNISNTPYVNINMVGGSFNTRKNSVKVGTGLLNNKYCFTARLSQIKSDGYIDRATSDLKSFFVSGIYRGDKDILKINVFSGKEKTYQAWEGIPKAKLNGDSAQMMNFAINSGYSQEEITNLFNSNNRTFNRYLYDNQTDNYQQDHYQFLYTRELSTNLKANVALHRTNGYGYYESYRYGKKLSKYGLMPIIYGTDTINRTNLIDRKYLDNTFTGFVGSVKYATNKISSTIGGGYNVYDGDHYGQIIWSQYNNGSIPKDYEYYWNNGYKTDGSIYLRNNLQLTNNLNIYADLQYRNISYKLKGLDDDKRDLKNNLNYAFFNPKLGFLYRKGNNSLYLTLSIANREPNRSTIVDADPNKPKPTHETLYDSELGYGYQSKTLTAKINFYGMYYDNQLVLTGNINDVGSAIMENVKKSYRTGVELSLAVKPIEQLQVQLNTTLSENKILNFTSYTDNWDTWGQKIENLGTTSISFSPNIIINGLISYSPIKSVTLLLSGNYVGKQYIDNTSRSDRELSDYFVSNLRVNYKISVFNIKNINLYTQVNNITNTEYITNAWIYPFISENKLQYLDGYFPQAKTNVLVGINLNF